MASRIAFYLLLCCLITSSRAQSVTIGFEQVMYTVYEGDEVEVCVNLLNGELDNRTVGVTLATDDMLGSGGMLISMDYVQVSENFTFSSDTELRTCVNITTIFNAGTNAASFSVNLTTTDNEVNLNPAAATVNIQDVTAPRITTQPMDMEGAFPDTEVNFTVVAEGRALSYQWFRNGEEISGATQATLTLTNVNIEMDEGMYHCFISNLAGNVTTDNVSLTILRRPEIAVLEAPTGSLLNQQITITCMTVINATITVMVNESDGTSLSLTNVETTENSRSVNVTVMSTGRHNVTCVADNNGLTETNTTQFYGITITVADVTAGITARAMFFCNVTGATIADGVSYSWRQTQNGVFPVDAFPAQIFDQRVSGNFLDTLTITYLSGLEQNYDYRCTVSIGGMMNVIGFATGSLTSPGPEVVEGPQDQMLRTDERLVLNCVGENNMDATQELTIFWMFSSFDMQNSPRMYTVDDDSEVTEIRMDDIGRVNSSLTIPSVGPGDGGIYACLLSNRNGTPPITVMENATVNVFFTPQIVFTASPQSVPVGENVLLTCTITAEPLANFSEIVRIVPNEEDDVLANSSNPNGLRRFSLNAMITRAKFQRDNGTMFVCRATNANGPHEEDITITVRDIPAPINHANGDVTAQLASLSSVNVTWRIPEDNNDRITNYRIIFCARENETFVDCSLNNTFTVGGSITQVNRTHLRFVYTELLTEKPYEVVIRAVNMIGEQMSPMVGEGLRFNSAFPDDGQVVNVGFIPTTRMVIVTWELPLLAQETMPLNVTFNVTYFNNGSPNNRITMNVGYEEALMAQGFTIDLMEANSAIHTVEITAIYTVPNFVASLFTLQDVSTLDTNEYLLPGQTISRNVPPDGNQLTVTWTAPSNQNFLTGYSVSATTTPVRRRRQIANPMRISAGMTSATLTFTPFTDLTVDVDAVYNLPGIGEMNVNLLPSTTFQTPQRASSSPQNVMAETVDVLKVRLTWTAPANPNGIIIRYAVVATPDGGPSFDAEIQDPDALMHLTRNLLPNVVYTFQVIAINGFGRGASSESRTIRTNFNVFPPVISGTAIGTADIPRFTITANPFSDMYGNVRIYKVVVVRGTRVEPSDIPDSHLAPAGVSQFNYYVTSVGDFRNERRSTFTIGDGSTSTINNDDNDDNVYTNPPPDTGVDYYVFIRLYSDIDGAIFADSELTGVLRINTPLNPAVIIAPIAVVAVLLLVILIVLLVIVFLFTRPRRGYSIAATEDGVHRKKRGGGLELRRTRLFSPVVNVPVPDVFTSAGQPTTLVCEASGTPAPDVVWTQNNEPLDKERFIQLADSSLFINDTDLKDEGAYIVTATNSAGTAEQMVRVTVIRPSPPEPDPEHPPIQVGEFTEKIALLRANDDEGLEDEYSEVEPDITFTSYAAKININKNKNRYINIIPYDHSRVVLSLQDNTPGSDYINASYVDGFNRPNSYIATQGPQPSTFPDFWRMVWEFDCPTIVMVTNLKEEDKLKCHQYWPNYGSTTYGSIQVTLKGVENLAEYSIRTFQITPIAGQSRVQMPAREVKQFHFLVWPDHGVPQFATPLLSFRKRVAKYHPDKKGPMVVHCSAGVGRTGTFITIDTMLRQMESEGLIDIFNFVRHMRFRRNYMVQTAPQYVFIHDALLEAIMCGDNSIPAPELRKRLQDLMEVDPESKKSKLQLQFENLNSNSPQDDDFDSTIASLPDNMAKNRFKVHLPANDYRVPLGAPPPRSEGGDDDDDDEDEKKVKEEPDYICASFADGYRQRNAFIITQAPMSNTTGDFWKMIWEQKSAAIVMLTELEEDGKEMSVKYWPGEVGEASLFGSFQLELSEDEKDKGDYVTRKFKLSQVDAPQDCRIVTQFHFTKWPRSSTPKNPHSVIDLIDEIQRVQRKSGNQPITIHCDDGVSRTGAFCTLYSVLERVKVDQVVDVYLATKTLRIQRAGLLETLDQYIFVHKAVIEFLDSFSDYQNFK